MPAEAGIQAGLRKNWIPAFAGMTVGDSFRSASSRHVLIPRLTAEGCLIVSCAAGFSVRNSLNQINFICDGSGLSVRERQRRVDMNRRVSFMIAAVAALSLFSGALYAAQPPFEG